jgi:hypothetical protein
MDTIRIVLMACCCHISYKDVFSIFKCRCIQYEKLVNTAVFVGLIFDQYSKILSCSYIGQFHIIFVTFLKSTF